MKDIQVQWKLNCLKQLQASLHNLFIISVGQYVPVNKAMLLTFYNQEKSSYVPKSIGHFSPLML